MESSINLCPTLKLEAFGRWYLHQSPSSEDRSWLVRLTAQRLRQHLGREPLVADLEQPAIAEFLQAMEKQSCYRNVKDLLRSLRKQALLLKILDGRPGVNLLEEADGRDSNQRSSTTQPRPRAIAQLSEEQGTLWHYCLQFFRTNIRITSSDTKKSYAITLAHFREIVGHEPTPADLTEENVIAMVQMLRQNGKHAIATINCMKQRLCCVWKWLASKRIVDQFPTIPSLPLPKRIPKAWTREQIDTLFEACRAQKGWIGCCKASEWWTALHYVAWDSGERIGALLKLRWEHVDLIDGYVTIPAEIRKGQSGDMLYRMHPDTMQALTAIYLPERPEVFPWPWHPCYLWSRYKKLRRAVGLPCDRQSGFHRIRRSVASHLAADGHNATNALAHSSEHVTRKYYLDPRIIATIHPSDVLFRPTLENTE